MTSSRSTTSSVRPAAICSSRAVAQLGRGVDVDLAGDGHDGDVASLAAWRLTAPRVGSFSHLIRLGTRVALDRRPATPGHCRSTGTTVTARVQSSAEPDRDAGRPRGRCRARARLRHVERLPGPPGPGWRRGRSGSPRAVLASLTGSRDRRARGRTSARRSTSPTAGPTSSSSTGTASGKSLGYLVPVLSAVRRGPRPAPGAGATALYLAPDQGPGRRPARPHRGPGHPRGAGGDLRRRHPARRAALDPRARQRRPHQPRPPAPLAAARARALGAVPAVAALRRRRRVPRLPRASSARTSSSVLRRLRRVAARYALPPDLRARLRDRQPTPRPTPVALVGMPVTAVDRRRLASRGAHLRACGSRPTRWTSDRGARRRREAADLLADLVGRRACRPSRSPAAAPASRPWPRARAAAARAGGPGALGGDGRGIPGRLPPRRSGASSSARCASGELRGLAATNALELGHRHQRAGRRPAGRLARHAGHPVAAGRAGGRARAGVAGGARRRRRPARHLPASDHPEAIFGAPVEATVIDPHNPHVLGAAPRRRRGRAAPHRGRPADVRAAMRAAASTLLVARGHPAAAADGVVLGPRRPAGRPLSLRGVDEVVAHRRAPHRPGPRHVDEASAHAQVHTGAVHVHQGDTFVVTELDLEARRRARSCAATRAGRTHAQSVSAFDILGRRAHERRGRVEVSLRHGAGDAPR